MAFEGRTIQVVEDLSVEEQLYLYERARRLKAKHAVSLSADSAASDAPPLCEIQDADVPEKVDNPDATVYLLFMEGSTRTKESFRNAGIFHNVKVNVFSAETSSFQKSETITDTMKMLCNYTIQRSVFVVRTPLEGVCSWLGTVLTKHAERFGIPRPSFINAGDGRYTHPVNELIDVYSLLERLRWNRSSIHIALIGDLAHGRTAHSKVVGLKIFDKVKVDLVAPEAFGYPVEYRNKMRQSGFEVREFASLEQYIAQVSQGVATIWYFFQPQFNRCGDISQDDIERRRTAVTFRQEWQAQLPQNVVFFQTLPRDKEKPIIPLALDTSTLNGWDGVANNAYFLHVVLLSMIFGKIGRGIPQDAKPGEQSVQQVQAQKLLPFAEGVRGDKSLLPEFVEVVDLSGAERKRRPERATAGGSVPLEDGLVLDHVGMSSDASSCWERLRMVRIILGWSSHMGHEGVYPSGKGRGSLKGIMSLPHFDFEQITVPQLKVLASIVPGCTVNVIRSSKVLVKYRLRVPLRIYNLPNIRCKNVLCVSHPQQKQRDVVAFFERIPFYETSAIPDCKEAEYLFVCKYCRWPHQYEDIWTYEPANFLENDFQAVQL